VATRHICASAPAHATNHIDRANVTGGFRAQGQGRQEIPSNYEDDCTIDESSIATLNAVPPTTSLLAAYSISQQQQALGSISSARRSSSRFQVPLLNSAAMDTRDNATYDGSSTRHDAMYYGDIMLARMLQKTEDEKCAQVDCPPNANQKESTDAMLAHMIQNSEYDTVVEPPALKRDDEEGDTDAALARLLQADEYQNGVSAQDNSTAEESYMMATNTGKAVMFVKEMIETIQQIHANSTDPCECQVENIARDDLVYMAERLLDTQEEFAKDGKPHHIDLGYHFTKEEALERIRTDGLLTRKDQEQNSIGQRRRPMLGASYFGDGVYTANNPFAFDSFGPVGLIVARIKGRSLARGRQRVLSCSEVDVYDTIVGNKTPARSTKEEVVLRSSSQTLPLIRFPRSFSSQPQHTLPENVDSTLAKFHNKMQELVDKFFNVSRDFAASQDVVHAVAVTDVLPSFVSFEKLPVAILPPPGVPQAPAPADVSPRPRNPHEPTPKFSSPQLLSRRDRPASLNPPRLPASGNQQQLQVDSTTNELCRKWTYKAPDRLFDSSMSSLDSISIPTMKAKPEDCPICFDPIISISGAHAASSWKLGYELKVCGHAMHICCLSQALQASNRCPVCRECVSRPQGASPSGFMDITYSTTPAQCDGHRAIRITYTLEGGIQKPYHENPGESYHGDRRVAYLPDSPKGNRLLRRLVFAFRHGLTFRMGTSLTTGRKNHVTWASIHHKTSCRPGPHGYPDPGYFLNCNDELDRLGVPQNPTNEEVN
jgi:deltex-like protein